MSFIDNFALRTGDDPGTEGELQTKNLEFSSISVGTLDEKLIFSVDHYPAVVKLQLGNNNEQLPIYYGGKKASWKAVNDTYSMSLTEVDFDADGSEFKEIKLEQNGTELMKFKEEINGTSRCILHQGKASSFSFVSNESGNVFSFLHPAFVYSTDSTASTLKSEVRFAFSEMNCRFNVCFSAKVPYYLLPGNIQFATEKTTENEILTFPAESKLQFHFDETNTTYNVLKLENSAKEYLNALIPLECYSSSENTYSSPFQHVPDSWCPFIFNEVQAFRYTSPATLNFSSWTSTENINRSFYIYWFFNPEDHLTYDIVTFPLSTISFLGSPSSLLSFSTVNTETTSTLRCVTTTTVEFTGEKPFDSFQRMVIFYVNVFLSPTEKRVQIGLIDESSSDCIF